MIEIQIDMCCWCGPLHPIRVNGSERIPPGRHEARVSISHGMCRAAEAKWLAAISPPVTHPVTPTVSSREGTKQ